MLYLAGKISRREYKIMRRVKKGMNKQNDRVMNKVVDQAGKHMADGPKQLTFVNRLENSITRANPSWIDHQQKVDLPVFNTPQAKKMKKSTASTDESIGRNIVKNRKLFDMVLYNKLIFYIFHSI